MDNNLDVVALLEGYKGIFARLASKSSPKPCHTLVAWDRTSENLTLSLPTQPKSSNRINDSGDVTRWSHYSKQQLIFITEKRGVWSLLFFSLSDAECFSIIVYWCFLNSNTLVK